MNDKKKPRKTPHLKDLDSLIVAQYINYVRTRYAEENQSISVRNNLDLDILKCSHNNVVYKILKATAEQERDVIGNLLMFKHQKQTLFNTFISRDEDLQKYLKTLYFCKKKYLDALLARLVELYGSNKKEEYQDYILAHRFSRSYDFAPSVYSWMRQLYDPTSIDFGKITTKEFHELIVDLAKIDVIHTKPIAENDVITHELSITYTNQKKLIQKLTDDNIKLENAIESLLELYIEGTIDLNSPQNNKTIQLANILSTSHQDLLNVYTAINENKGSAAPHISITEAINYMLHLLTQKFIVIAKYPRVDLESPQGWLVVVDATNNSRKNPVNLNMETEEINGQCSLKWEWINRKVESDIY